MKKWDKAYIGSISSGTMRTLDLLETFSSFLNYHIDVLEEHEKTKLNEIRDSISKCKENENYDDWQPYENCEYDLEELFDLLNNHAPAGTHFGSHEGDGADYGFWINYEDVINITDEDKLDEVIGTNIEEFQEEFPFLDDNLYPIINMSNNIIGFWYSDTCSFYPRNLEDSACHDVLFVDNMYYIYDDKRQVIVYTILNQFIKEVK